MLIEAAQVYGRAGSAAIFWAMGITQSTHGTDNVQALANLALLTGNFGRPGTGVNPLRGRTTCRAPVIWWASECAYCLPIGYG